MGWVPEPFGMYPVNVNEPVNEPESEPGNKKTLTPFDKLRAGRTGRIKQSFSSGF